MTGKIPQVRRPEIVRAELENLKTRLSGRVAYGGTPEYEKLRQELELSEARIEKIKEAIARKKAQINYLKSEIPGVQERLTTIRNSIELREKELAEFESDLQELIG